MPDQAQNARKQIVLTTHAGLEKLVVEELHSVVGRDLNARLAPGRAVVDIPEAARGKLFALRSVHHVLEGVAHRRLPTPVTLEAVQTAVRSIEIPGLAEADSFRVTSVRRGQHAFNHMAIERAAGAALFEAAQTPVRLDHPALNVRVDLDEDVLWVGIALTARPLSRRAKVYAQKIGLSADLAFAAVHVAALADPARILDPFCGSGTLLLEAGAVYPQAELWGSDWVEGAVDGARANLEAAGFAERARMACVDAQRMSEEYPAASFDGIVSNPPFGVKMGPRIDFYRFYGRFLREADRVLKPEGRIALWVHRLGQLNAAAKLSAFRPYRTITVQAGSARPSLVALERRSHA